MDATDLYIGVRDLNLDVQGKINTEDLDLKAKLVHLGYGNWTLTLPREHEMAELLRTPGSGIIVQQKVNGLWETKFSGPTTSPSTKRTPEDPNGLLTVQGTDDNILLWDTLAWGDPTNVLTAQATSNDIRTGPAETVMKQYVDYNLGPSALSARRGALAQLLTIQTNGATGPTVSKSPRFQNLGELLAEIALYADMGFRIVQVGNGLVFETYSIVDNTGTVRFDIESGTLTEETLAVSPPGVTRTIVAGQGEGIERTLIQRTTTDSLSAEGDWGRSIEKWIDQRNTDDTDELNQAGDEPLIASGFTGIAVKAVPADAHTMKFGPDWGLGDLVRVVVEGAEETALITEVAIVANSAGVEIGAAIGDVSSFAVSTNLQSQVSSVSNRVSALERSTGAGYIYTDAATPNTIVRRDANGRAKVAAPAADGDIVNKITMDTNIATALASAIAADKVFISRTPASDAPSTYAVGLTIGYNDATDDGYPIGYATIRTFKYSDVRVIQEIGNSSTSAATMYRRYANGSSAWHPWFRISEVSGSWYSGWASVQTNILTASVTGAYAEYKREGAFVIASGLVGKTGGWSTSANTLCMYFPSGWRPAKRCFFPAASTESGSGSNGIWVIETDGSLTLRPHANANSSGYYSLDGIRFQTDVTT